MPDYPTCPKCRGQDVAVLAVEQYPAGVRTVLLCDSCGARHQTWQPAVTP